jgi:hypothetical protein
MTVEFTERAILKVVPAVPEYTISTPSLTITKIEDLPNERKVIVYTDHPEAKSILLWEEDAYDAIGQWIDTDVENRLKEIYENV